MTLTDLATLHAQLAAITRDTLEAILAAAFLAFCWWVAPHVTGNGSRR